MSSPSHTLSLTFSTLLCESSIENVAGYVYVNINVNEYVDIYMYIYIYTYTYTVYIYIIIYIVDSYSVTCSLKLAV